MNKLQACLVFFLWHLWMSGCGWSVVFFFNAMNRSSNIEIVVFSTIVNIAITLIAYRESSQFYASRCIL